MKKYKREIRQVGRHFCRKAGLAQPAVVQACATDRWSFIHSSAFCQTLYFGLEWGEDAGVPFIEKYKIEYRHSDCGRYHMGWVIWPQITPITELVGSTNFYEFRCPTWEHGDWGRCGNVCISEGQGSSFVVVVVVR